MLRTVKKNPMQEPEQNPFPVGDKKRIQENLYFINAIQS